MQNVLVLTMPNTRNYTINPDVNSDSMVRTAQCTPALSPVGASHTAVGRPPRATDAAALCASTDERLHGGLPRRSAADWPGDEEDYRKKRIRGPTHGVRERELLQKHLVQW